MATVFGELVRSRRKELGLTQKELGEKLSLSGQAVSGWERDDKYPDIFVLPKLRRVLNLSADMILKSIEGIVIDERELTVSAISSGNLDNPENFEKIKLHEMADKALRECINKQDNLIHFTDDRKDTISSDLRRAEIYMVAGPQGCGKTNFLLNVTNNVLRNNNGKVYYFTMGTMGKEIIKRLLSIEAGVTTRHHKVRYLSEEDKKKLSAAGEFYHNVSLYLDDQHNHSIEDIYRKCTSVDEDLDLIVIDGIERVTEESPKPNESSDISSKDRLIRKLHGLAIEFRCPVIFSCDFNRNIERRKNQIPKLRDISDQLLMKHSDHVMMLYSEDCYRVSNEWDGMVDLIIAKDTYRMIFDPVKNEMYKPECGKPFIIRYKRNPISLALTAIEQKDIEEDPRYDNNDYWYHKDRCYQG